MARRKWLTAFVELSERGERVAQVAVRARRSRLRRDGAPELRGRLGHLPLGGERDAQVVLDVRAGRTLASGEAEVLGGFLRPVQVDQRVGEVVVRVGVVRLQGERPFVRRDRFGQRPFDRSAAPRLLYAGA